MGRSEDDCIINRQGSENLDRRFDASLKDIVSISSDDLLYFTMRGINVNIVLAALGLAPMGTLGANLLVSHFSGKLYSLSFTQNGSSGTLQQTGEFTGCGTTPGWIEYYSDTKQLYCFDESWFGSGQIAQYSVANDGRLTLTASARSTGNSVHGLLYGGSDGKGYIATAE